MDKNKIIVDIISDFYQNLVPHWNSLLDFKVNGKLWLKNIENTYNDPEITDAAHDALLNAISNKASLIGCRKV